MNFLRCQLQAFCVHKANLINNKNIIQSALTIFFVRMSKGKGKGKGRPNVGEELQEERKREERDREKRK